ncbi:MAG: hypothetical protein KatS3mg059_1312 [Thermomicrobiales bacterium]|nr:MAG: hypothetical protein KatS3mg059_1312 [Thermomicrobiales bacterium]
MLADAPWRMSPRRGGVSFERSPASHQPSGGALHCAPCAGLNLGASRMLALLVPRALSAGLKTRAQGNTPAQAGWSFLLPNLGAPARGSSAGSGERGAECEREPGAQSNKPAQVGWTVRGSPRPSPHRGAQGPLPRCARDKAHHANKPAQAGSLMKRSRVFWSHMHAAPFRGLICLSAGLEPRAMPARDPDTSLAIRSVLSPLEGAYLGERGA